MDNSYSMDDLLDFLNHAGERGLMPTATAQALAVASRNVFGVLSDEEKNDLSATDIEAVIKRFMNKRAREFNPSSLKEYGRRVRRAVELYTDWRENPADFSVRTRTTESGRKKSKTTAVTSTPASETESATSSRDPRGYSSSVAVRPGRIVTISNIPDDLTTAEAERLAQFVRMLPT